MCWSSLTSSASLVDLTSTSIQVSAGMALIVVPPAMRETVSAVRARSYDA
jgi:hypothetical protein